MASRKRRGRSFWSPLVAKFEQTSGVTQAAFARQQGVHPNTLRNWIYKLRDEPGQADARLDDVRFVEVEVPASAPSTEQVRLEVGAVCLHLDRVPEAGWLAELVHQTRGGSPC